MDYRKPLIDLTEAELEARYRELIQQQGQDAAMTLLEVSRRATLKVRDAAIEVRDASHLIHEASMEIVRLSKNLERLTKFLIVLTVVLGVLTIPLTIEAVAHWISKG